MRGSSPRMTGFVFGTVPALRGGMKNAVSRVRDTDSLRRLDHLAHEAAEAADVTGRIDRVAEAHDHHVLGRQDDDTLAEVAGGEEGVARNAHCDAAFGVRMLAAIGPETGAVVGVQRRGCGQVYPVLMQQTSSANH